MFQQPWLILSGKNEGIATQQLAGLRGREGAAFTQCKDLAPAKAGNGN